MTTTDRADVLLAYRYQASRVLNVVSQANILVEHGLHVVVAETGSDEQPEEGGFDDRVKRLVTRAFWEPANAPTDLVTRWRQHQGYTRHMRSILDAYRPKVIIAFDIDSCLAVADLARDEGAYVIFHFCEQPDLRMPLSFFRRWKTRQVLQKSRFAQLIVHPDPYRAAVFLADAHLNQEPLMVPNCPRLVRDWAKSNLKVNLENQVGGDRRIVAYVGGIAPGRGLLETVESMRMWPADAVLVCRGLVFPDFADRLRQRALELGVADRLIIQEVRGFERDAVWAAHLAVAEVGIALHESVNLNQFYSAFASTKLHQYMAAGIPLIARTGPGFDELVDLAETGICVDLKYPDSLGQAVARLLSDDAYRARLGQNGRRLHLTHFNYERCFAPVLQNILEQCRNAAG
jgi:glycosyltransferase involved in cell wall biosynthesis